MQSSLRFLLPSLSFLLLGTLVSVAHSDAAQPQFQPQVIDSAISIGYGVSLGDVDGDKRVDIVLADKTDIVWYRNPGGRDAAWSKHVIARQLTTRDNVCVAVRDIDGDGKVEIAVGANWNPGETTSTRDSGAVFSLVRPSDPTQLWGVEPLTPHQPTVHRMHWVKWDSGEDTIGNYRLLVLPLHGVGNRGGNGESVKISAYQVGADGKQVGQPTLLDTKLHMTHNFDVLTRGKQSEAVVVGGREGLIRLDAKGHRVVVEAPDGRGAGEVRRSTKGDAVAFAAIEPMHGQQVVVYARAAGKWNRQVLDASLNQGHALACGDLLGRGHQQVVAGWRAKNGDGRVGIRLYDYNLAEGTWTSSAIDDDQMACEDLKLLDFDQDGKLDIIAAGRATNNLVVYWNEN